MVRPAFAFTPLARNACVAVTVVSRSSAMRTGINFSSPANLRLTLEAISVACLTLEEPFPFSVRGRPITTSTTSYSLIKRSMRSISALSSSSNMVSLDMVSTGVARMQPRSETATPIRTVPTSSASLRPCPGSSLPGLSGVGCMWFRFLCCWCVTQILCAHSCCHDIIMASR